MSRHKTIYFFFGAAATILAFNSLGMLGHKETVCCSDSSQMFPCPTSRTKPLPSRFAVPLKFYQLFLVKGQWLQAPDPR